VTVWCANHGNALIQTHYLLDKSQYCKFEISENSIWLVQLPRYLTVNLINAKNN